MEPFLGGSHAQFVRTLTERSDGVDWTVLSLPGRHWKWRMRGSAAWFAHELEGSSAADFDVLLASSFLPLAELRGLVPWMAQVPTVLQFHENQLAYPAGPQTTEFERRRDHHFGFTQLVSALAADACLFNSAWNRDSFLEEGARLLARMPDAVRPDWTRTIADRSVVLPIPLGLPDVAPPLTAPTPEDRALGPRIVWPHRFEHDKGPALLVATLRALLDRDTPFRLLLLGERHRRGSAVLDELRDALGDRLVHDGHVPGRDAYVELLSRADLVLSTARHEFFGVAVAEAVWQGAFPLVPNALAYVERYPPECRYDPSPDDCTALADRLNHLCRAYAAGTLDLRADRRDWLTDAHAPSALPRYHALLRRVAEG